MVLPLSGRRRFTSKPPRGMRVEFDPAYAAERDLRFATLFDSDRVLHDISPHGGNPKHVGTSGVRSMSGGNTVLPTEHMRFTQTGSQWIFGSMGTDDPLSFSDVDRISLATRFYAFGGNNYREFVTKANNTNGTGGYTLGTYRTQRRFWGGVGGNYFETIANNLWSDNTLYSYAVRVNLALAGSEAQFFRNGAPVGVRSVPGFAFPTNSNPFSIGGRFNATGQSQQGLEYVYLFGEVMDTAWARELHRNPYRYLRQVVPSVVFLPQAGASHSIAGDVSVIVEPAASMALGRAITGDVEVITEPASTMVRNINPSIVGDTQNVVEPAAALQFNINPSFDGDTQNVIEVAADMSFGSSATINGDVQVVVDVLGAMVRNINPSVSGDVQNVIEVLSGMSVGRSFDGDVQVIVDPASPEMFKNINPSVSGDVQAVVEVAGSMEFGGAAQIAGDVQVVLEITSSTAYQQNPSISGDIQAVIEVLSEMGYSRNFAIAGDVQAVVDVAASEMRFNRNYTIVGDVENVIEVTATMTFGKAAIIAGDVEVLVVPESVMEGPIAEFVSGNNQVWYIDGHGYVWAVPLHGFKWRQ